MLYRKLDSNGDYTFGKAAGNFFKDIPEAVGQAVLTRLKLIEGEWFLDTSIGTPYNSQILGMGKLNTYDGAIQNVILNTQGVTALINYASFVDPNTRAAGVSATINTVYGTTAVQTNL